MANDSQPPAAAPRTPNPDVAYGGQAVIEGVMIRSPRYISVACRMPQADGKPGSDTPIDVHTEPVVSPFQKRPWLRRVPLLRGFLALFEMLSLGLRALERSGNLQLAAAAPIILALGLVSPPAKNTDGKGALNGPLMLAAIVPAFGIGLILFVFLPNLLADLIGRGVGAEEHGLLLNALEGVVRLVIFLLYVGLIGLLPDIRRVFQYHGAEHKAVNGHEAGVPLTVAEVMPMSVIHPRCGTNFAFIVIFVSLIVFSFLPWTPSVLERVGMRLLCLPLVAGIGFELIKLVGAHRDVAWLQRLVAPGLWMQRLTTREPQPEMVQVALASFLAVRHAEEHDELTCEVRDGVMGELL